MYSGQCVYIVHAVAWPTDKVTPSNVQHTGLQLETHACVAQVRFLGSKVSVPNSMSTRSAILDYVLLLVVYSCSAPAAT